MENSSCTGDNNSEYVENLSLGKDCVIAIDYSHKGNICLDIGGIVFNPRFRASDLLPEYVDSTVTGRNTFHPCCQTTRVGVC